MTKKQKNTKRRSKNDMKNETVLDRVKKPKFQSSIKSLI